MRRLLRLASVPPADRKVERGRGGAVFLRAYAPTQYPSAGRMLTLADLLVD